MADKTEISFFSEEYALLKMRNLIAIKEFNTSSGNLELAKYGEWRCDRYGINSQIQEEIEELETKLNRFLESYEISKK